MQHRRRVESSLSAYETSFASHRFRLPVRPCRHGRSPLSPQRSPARPRLLSYFNGSSACDPRRHLLAAWPKLVPLAHACLAYLSRWSQRVPLHARIRGTHDSLAFVRLFYFPSARLCIFPRISLGQRATCLELSKAGDSFSPQCNFSGRRA